MSHLEWLLSFYFFLLWHLKFDIWHVTYLIRYLIFWHLTFDIWHLCNLTFWHFLFIFDIFQKSKFFKSLINFIWILIRTLQQMWPCTAKMANSAPILWFFWRVLSRRRWKLATQKSSTSVLVDYHFHVHVLRILAAKCIMISYANEHELY